MLTGFKTFTSPNIYSLPRAESSDTLNESSPALAKKQVKNKENVIFSSQIQHPELVPLIEPLNSEDIESQALPVVSHRRRNVLISIGIVACSLITALAIFAVMYPDSFANFFKYVIV